MHIHRWDLDRTYLDTDIHSVRGLIRTALETAGEKRNIPGSAALIRAIVAADPGARIHILSGSPTQLRPVLEEKLALDGVRVDRMILKDNLGNLRRGRLSAVRGQVGYKLTALLEERAALTGPAGETLFGDDSESDAVIYAAYAAALAGELSEPELVRLLTAGGAYPDVIAAAVAAFRRLPRAASPPVEDIFIHLDQRSPLTGFAGLPRVTPVFSWFQAAVVLWSRGRLPQEGVVEVARAAAAEARLPPIALVGLLQDLARRGVVTGEQLLELTAAEGFASLRARVAQAVALLGPSTPLIPRGGAPDFVAALQRSRVEG